MEPDAGGRLADRLGRALQLTNILRDLDEDADCGRLYLPAEFLREAGIDTDDPVSALAHPNISAACQRLASSAQAHFHAATEVMDEVKSRAMRAPRIMAEVYQSILSRLEQRGWTAPRRPVGVGRSRIVWILLRAALP